MARTPPKSSTPSMARCSPTTSFASPRTGSTTTIRSATGTKTPAKHQPKTPKTHLPTTPKTETADETRHPPRLPPRRLSNGTPSQLLTTPGEKAEFAWHLGATTPGNADV